MQIARNILLAIAMLIWPALAFPVVAQNGIVKGKVVKQTDGTGILNAIVRIRDSDKSTRTDDHGNYIFESLNPGQIYTLDMSKNPLYDPGNTTATAKADVPGEAENVALVRRPPDVRAIRDLIDWLDKRDLARFETEIESREQQCRGETDSYCKTITAIRKLIDKPLDKPTLLTAETKLAALKITIEGQLTKQ